MRLRPHLLIAVALVATTRVAAATPAKHYARLFVKSATFVYEVKVTTLGPIADTPFQKPLGLQTTTSTVTCKVTDVVKVGKALATEIECDDAASNLDLGIAGRYVATAKGLYFYRGGTLPTSTADLALADELLIASTPKRTIERGDGAIHTLLYRAKEGWCEFRYTHFMRSERCFGGAITRGQHESYEMPALEFHLK
jgi:hypothetical protein